MVRGSLKKSKQSRLLEGDSTSRYESHARYAKDGDEPDRNKEKREAVYEAFRKHEQRQEKR